MYILNLSLLLHVLWLQYCYHCCIHYDTTIIMDTDTAAFMGISYLQSSVSQSKKFRITETHTRSTMNLLRTPDTHLELCNGPFHPTWTVPLPLTAEQ